MKRACSLFSLVCFAFSFVLFSCKKVKDKGCVPDSPYVVVDSTGLLDIPYNQLIWDFGFVIDGNGDGINDFSMYYQAPSIRINSLHENALIKTTHTQDSIFKYIKNDTVTDNVPIKIYIRNHRRCKKLNDNYTFYSIANNTHVWHSSLGEEVPLASDWESGEYSVYGNFYSTFFWPVEESPDTIVYHDYSNIYDCSPFGNKNPIYIIYKIIIDEKSNYGFIKIFHEGLYNYRLQHVYYCN